MLMDATRKLVAYPFDACVQQKIPAPLVSARRVIVVLAFLLCGASPMSKESSRHFFVRAFSACSERRCAIRSLFPHTCVSHLFLLVVHERDFFDGSCPLGGPLSFVGRVYASHGSFVCPFLHRFLARLHGMRHVYHKSIVSLAFHLVVVHVDRSDLDALPRSRSIRDVVVVSFSPVLVSHPKDVSFPFEPEMVSFEKAWRKGKGTTFDRPRRRRPTSKLPTPQTWTWSAKQSRLLPR